MRLLVLPFLLAILAGPVLANPPLASAYGRLPGVESAAVSPDGTRVAVLGGPPASRRLLIIPTAGGPQVGTDLGSTLVRDVDWAADDRVALTITDLVSFGNGGIVSNEERLRRLRQRNTPADQRTYLFQRTLLIDNGGELVGRVLSNSSEAQLSSALPVIGITGGESPRLMVQGFTVQGELSAMATRFEANGARLLVALWRVDPRTGHGESAEIGSLDTQGYMVDLSGEARVRIDGNASRGRVVLVRAKGSRRWRELGRFGEFDGDRVLGYSDPEDALYLLRHENGRPSIWRQPLAGGEAVRIATGVEDGELRVRFDRYQMSPISIIAGAGERPQVQWLDDELASAQRRLAASFRGACVDLVSWSRDRRTFVAQVRHASRPADWYLYDARTNRAQVLGDAYPELANSALGVRRWISYRARDGLTIPAYVTIPPGVGPRAPLIVMPHGGPAVRDEFGFDWWSQYLASLGYVVLQPQFRGSSGFGEAFERAGNGEWAGAIQNDLLDGISHLASSGLVDPSRVCIVGASFGGYAAMAGVTYHPEAYRCGVSVAGVSDLPAMLGWTSRSAGEDADALRYWRRNMGSSSPEVLSRSSPARQALTSSSPILLIHGENDTVVPFEQSLMMERALRRAGRPVEMLTLQGEDHYLSTAATRTQMLEGMARFLARHLPVTAPGAQPAPAAPTSQP